mgnify:CR=1 FL=1
MNGNFQAVQLLKAVEVQEILRVSRATAYRLMRSGALPTIRINGVVRVPLQDLIQWMNEKKRCAKPTADSLTC